MQAQGSGGRGTGGMGLALFPGNPPPIIPLGILPRPRAGNGTRVTGLSASSLWAPPQKWLPRSGWVSQRGIEKVLPSLISSLLFFPPYRSSLTRTSWRVRRSHFLNPIVQSQAPGQSLCSAVLTLRPPTLVLVSSLVLPSCSTQCFAQL